MNAHTKTETITPDGEIITTALAPAENKSMAVSLARAEIDMQITTAHAYPRSVDRAVKNIMSLATLDERSAAECIYALPRGGKPIRGPSVRFAEIIMSQWGNCRAGARVVHVDRIERYVEAEGVFHDLETNSATTARVRRRISDKHGAVFNEDMIVVTGNAACAIARRNAILGGVPKAVWRGAEEAVEKVIAGDVMTLAENRERAIKAFAMFGVKPEQVFVALDVGGEADIGLEHVLTLRGMFSAIKNGEATVEEMFPKPPVPAGDRPKDLNGKLDVLAKKNGENGTPAPAFDSPQPAAPQHQAAADEAAPGAQPQETPAHAPGAVAEEWPSGAIPKTEADYQRYARAWFGKVERGEITPDDAAVQWKADKGVRNKANVSEDIRDALKGELDAILAAKKG